MKYFIVFAIIVLATVEHINCATVANKTETKPTNGTKVETGKNATTVNPENKNATATANAKNSTNIHDLNAKNGTATADTTAKNGTVIDHPNLKNQTSTDGKNSTTKTNSTIVAGKAAGSDKNGTHPATGKTNNGNKANAPGQVKKAGAPKK